MRRKVVKPKERRKIRIPSDLKEACREVFELLQEAKRNGEPPIDFGDAIQVGGLCGGRVGKKPRPFVFTYHSPQGRRAKWELTLHRTEIEDIGDGRMTELMMYCCTSPNCEMKFREPEEACFFCDYEDDAEVVAWKERLRELAGVVKSKEEWVAAYLLLKPDATGGTLIGDYNPIDGLGERLGWFSLKEADEIIRRLRAEDGK